jgi:hypothetical protein
VGKIPYVIYENFWRIVTITGKGISLALCKEYFLPGHTGRRDEVLCLIKSMEVALMVETKLR